MADAKGEIGPSLIPEFDLEMSNTRKLLERIPEDKFDWSPHPKSMNVQALTTHVCNLSHWGTLILREQFFDLQPVGEEPVRATPIASVSAGLATFDAHVTAARDAILESTDEHLMALWELRSGGEQLFKLPRVFVLRTMVMNHMIHHRAQLGVYLRMNDTPLPPLYGPSADESPHG